MFSRSDDPLARAVSLMGRVSNNRIYRNRMVQGSGRRPFHRRSLQELRISQPESMGSPGAMVPGMELLRGVYSLTQINHITIDSLVFRLHCNATVILLVSFSIAVTTRQYVGNPIDCVHTRDIPEDVLNTYCWIHSTYTVIDAFLKSPGTHVAYPGVENSYSKGNGRSPVKQVKYYQWVAFMLFFQVKSALVPRVKMGFLDMSIFHTLFKISKLKLNSKAFSFSTSMTAYILIGFFGLTLSKYMWSESIDCLNREVDAKFYEVWCWIQGTYSVEAAFNKTVGVDIIYPGVQMGVKKDKRYYFYYQWTPLILVIQAILFYTPRWLWKSWEGGKIHALMMDLDIGICSDTEKRMKKKLMVDYLWENFRYHNWWAYKYYFCELLALINIIGQMFLMNRFFDGAFLTFGIKVLAFMDSDQEDRIDPIIQVFPKMTKCTFYKYGVSGEVERHDAICILPLNVVNEKIYVFLWFWFVILALMTAITILYRIIIILSPRMRVYLLRLRYRLMKKEDIDLIVRRSKMGDWFLFYMLGENVDSIIFRDVIHELATKLRVHQLDFARGYKDIQEP